MRASEAVRIVNSAIWRPGIRVNARVDWEDAIAVEIVFDTYNSSAVSGSGQYTDRAMIAPVKTIMTGDIQTEDELLFRVLGWLREAQEHEDREFTRVQRNGRWTAPFHPHNASGNAAWYEAGLEGRRTSRYR